MNQIFGREEGDAWLWPMIGADTEVKDLSSEDYLNKSEIQFYLQHALSHVQKFQPPEPLKYFSDFLESVRNCTHLTNIRKSNGTLSFEYLNATLRNRVHFCAEMKPIILNVASSSCATKPFSCSEFEQLLRLYCSDFPPNLVRQTYEAIEYNNPSSSNEEIWTSFTSCWIFQEYLLHVRSQYQINLRDAEAAAGPATDSSKGVGLHAARLQRIVDQLHVIRNSTKLRKEYGFLMPSDSKVDVECIYSSPTFTQMTLAFFKSSCVTTEIQKMIEFFRREAGVEIFKD